MRKKDKEENLRFASELHAGTPPNWYYQSLKVDILQRYWHKRRFSEISKLIESVDDAVLDIGSADGMFSKVILDKTGAKRLVGIDVLKDSVDWANKHWKSTGKMNFFVGDAQNLGFKSEEFDAVFALEVLEHVANPERVLAEIKRVLKKRKYGIFLVPSDSLLFRVVWYIWLKFYPRGWVWKDTHIQTYRDNYLPKLCRKVGFIVEKDNKFLLGMLQAVKVRKV